MKDFFAPSLYQKDTLATVLSLWHSRYLTSVFSFDNPWQRLHLPRLRCGIVGDSSSPLRWHFKHSASSFDARCTSILERAGAALKKRITITIAKIRPITQTMYISVLALACSVGIYLKRNSLFKKWEEGRYIFCRQRRSIFASFKRLSILDVCA